VATNVLIALTTNLETQCHIPEDLNPSMKEHIESKKMNL